MRLSTLLACLLLLCCARCAFAQPYLFERLGSPFGGTSTGFVTAPDGTLYTGTELAGIHRSTDDGVTWEESFDPSENYQPQVAFDNGTVIAIAFGNTWIVRNHTAVGDWRRFEFYGFLGARYVHSAAAIGGRLFIGTDNGVGVSADTGSTWRLVGEEGRTVMQLSASGSILYALSEDLSGPPFAKQLARSDDLGETWDLIELPPGSPLPTIAATPTGLLVHMPQMGLRIWRIGEETIGSFDTTTRTRREGLIASSVNGTIVLQMEGSLFFYNSDGTDLYSRELPSALRDVRSISFAADGSLLIGSRGEGIYRSTDDGRSWRQQGLSKASRFYSLHVLPGGDLLASVEGRGLIRTSDPETGWSAIGPEGEDFYYTAIGADGTWWGAVERGIIAHSTDQGASWSYDSTGFNVSVSELSITESGAILMATNGGIIRSNDGGETWSQVSQWHNAYRFAYAPDGTIWSAGYDVILHSTDDGISWNLFKPSASGLPVGGTDAVTVTSAGSILVQLVGFQMPLIRSDDGGTTWHLGTRPCEEGGWLFHVSGSRIFAITYCGLYYSDDDGRSWHYGGELPEGLGQTTMLEAEPGLFYLATNQGMYRVSQTSSIGSDIVLPTRLDLR